MTHPVATSASHDPALELSSRSPQNQSAPVDSACTLDVSPETSASPQGHSGGVERLFHPDHRGSHPDHPGFHPDHPGLIHAIQSLLYIIVVAIFIITFSVQPFRIPSGSMEPTLLIGDFLLVDKQGPSIDGSDGLLPPAPIRRGEIIVFHYPVDPSVHLVKRVIGMPGDHLKLREGRVFINGTPLAEPYAMYTPAGPDSFRDSFPRLQNADPNIDSRWWIRMRTLIDDGELIIPADNYFVLGDNRNNSEDSRYWGFVPRNAIVGRPFLIYFSLQRGSGETPTLLPPAAGRPRSRAAEALADFARWDRTLQVVH